MAKNPYYWDEVNASRMGKYVTGVEIGFLRRHIADLPRTSRVLYLGCGSGREMVAMRNEGFSNGVGLDPDGDYLKVAQEKVPEMSVVVGVATQLPFEDKSFDVLVGIEMMGYFEDWLQFFREIHRVLKPGGRLILQVTNKHSLKGLAYGLYKRVNKRGKVAYAYTLSFRQIKDMMSRHSLEIIATEGFNWNLLYRASNSLLVDACAAIEKLGFRRLASYSPWIMICARKTAVKR